MIKWIDFNLRHPKFTLGMLVIFTLIAIAGLLKIEFDSSTEALMPRSDIAFKMGEKVKTEFADTKTYITVALVPKQKATENDPQKTEQLILSSNYFAKLKLLAEELETFQEYNFENEEKNLQNLLTVAGARIISEKTEQPQKSVTEPENKKTEEDLDAQFLKPQGKEEITTRKSAEEQDLDAAFLNNTKTKESVQLTETADDFWNSNTIIDEEQELAVDKKIKKIEKIEFSNFQNLSLQKIRTVLDENAQRQLTSILRYKEISLQEGQSISQNQMHKIIEAWLLFRNYKKYEIIKSLLDPISVEDLVGSKTELKPVALLSKVDGQRQIPQNQKEFEIYKQRLTKTPAFESTLYSLNSQGQLQALGMSIILKPMRDHQQIADILWSVISKYNEDPFDIYVMGNLIFNKFMNELNQRDLKQFLPLVIVMVILTFYLNFRSLRGVVLPTITVALASLWTMGLHGLFAIKLTIIGTILPPLLIAVGSSYSIHIFNQYMLEKKLHGSHGQKQRLVSSMHHIITTVALAGFTTIIGFATLSVNQVTALKSFGIFAALGTFFAVFISVSLIPSALYLLKEEKEKKSKENAATDNPEANSLIQNFSHSLSNWVINFPKTILAITLVLVAIAAWGTSKMTTNTAPSAYFKEGSYVKEAGRQIGNLFKGDLILNVVFDSKQKGGAYEPEFLNYIEGLRQYLKQQRISDDYNIMHTTSFADFIKRMHMAMNEDKSQYYAIPPDSVTIRDYMEIFSGEDRDSDGRADAFEIMVDKKFQKINLMVKLGENKIRGFSTNVSRKAKALIEEYLNQNKPAQEYKWAVVGMPLNFVVLGDLITSGQIQSILLSTLIVGLVIFLLFKNIGAGFVALIPISIAVLVIFGSMGFMEIPLDIAQAILSSIAIGIGVDDTIHFLNTIRRKLKDGLTLDEAIRKTHDEAGIAIIYTSVALISGFAILMLSSFTPIFNFGFLVSTVMLATTIGALIILPATIKFFNLHLHREKNWKFLHKLNLGRFLE